jgi:tRNA threonylcarbamoyladenosine biosynthesis protein TsaE
MAQTLISRSETETVNCGAEFAKSLRRGDNVALYGQLGSGKTRFIQGICKGLGVREHVASPTFTIVNEYNAGDVKIYHFDFYRMKSLREIQQVGFEEYTSNDGICLIAWAEKAQELLPPDRYDVRLELGSTEDTRAIAIEHVVEVAL